MNKDYATLKKIQVSNGFQWFDEAFKPNLIGVRTKEIIPNVFNDIMYCAWKDKNGKEFVIQYDQTTFPGKYYLESREHRPKEGCGILLANKQYHSWIRLKHGKARPHFALVQRVGGVDIARDNNTNSMPEVSGPDSKVFLNVYIGLNIHGPWESNEVKFINADSAACQVADDKKFHEQMMWVVEEFMKEVLGFLPTEDQTIKELENPKGWWRKVIISYTIYDEDLFKIKE